MGLWPGWILLKFGIDPALDPLFFKGRSVEYKQNKVTSSLPNGASGVLLDQYVNVEYMNNGSHARALSFHGK